MEPEYLTYLEKKFLNDVLRPALTDEQPDHLYGFVTRSQTLNFRDLLDNLKDFYERNGGVEWQRLCLEPKRSHSLHQHYEIERPSSPQLERDALFDQAKELVQRTKSVSAGLLQRTFKIPYVQSAKLLDQLEAAGIIGPKEGAKPRKVL